MHNKFTDKGSIGIIKENWLKKDLKRFLHMETIKLISWYNESLFKVYFGIILIPIWGNLPQMYCILSETN